MNLQNLPLPERDNVPPTTLLEIPHMRFTLNSLLLFVVCVSVVVAAGTRSLSATHGFQQLVGKAAQDKSPADRKELDAMLQQGGDHWSVPDKMRGLDAPAADTFVYLTPKQDQVFELRRDEQGRYKAIIELKWMQASGTVIPVSGVKNVRTHIFFHQLEDAGSWAFGNTRSIIAAREKSGSLNFKVSTENAFDGERDLLFHVTTNDNPGQPVANFLKLRVRIAK